MKSQIAVYESHKKAIEAIKTLNQHSFSLKHVSVIGQAELVDNHLHIKSLEGPKEAVAVIGLGAGTVLGLLSGLGAFAIPGFGFLYGAGALVGVLGGFDLGLVSGGILSFLTRIGVQEDSYVNVEKHLKAGNFLVVINGSPEEIEKAKEILHTENSHLDYVD